MRLLLASLLFVLISIGASAQRTTPVGKWKTVDDATGKVKSMVEIFEKGGKLHGRVLDLFDPPEPDPKCDKCAKEDPRHGKPVRGLEVIRNMVQDGKEWADGDILDPRMARSIVRGSGWRTGSCRCAATSHSSTAHRPGCPQIRTQRSVPSLSPR